MKKFFLLLMLALGLVAFTPKAEAGQYARVHSKYGTTYVHKSALYGNNYHGGRNYYGGSRYRNYGRSYYGHRHYQPVRYSRRSYYRSYDDDCYRPTRYYSNSRYYSSRPRFAISFGF